MAMIHTSLMPQLHELQPLSATEIRSIAVVTPTARTLENNGLWIFVDERDGRLWLGQQAEQIHPEDRWLYHSTLEDEPEHEVAFWSSVGGAHGKRMDTVDRGDIDPYLRVQNFVSRAYTTNHSLRNSYHLPTRDNAWLLACAQLFNSIGEFTIQVLPERVDWAALHDIVWHFDAFRARHGIEDMPLDLILRMHGFGKLADTNPRLHPLLGIGWDWKDPHVAE
jgi:hypothetical protein